MRLVIKSARPSALEIAARIGNGLHQMIMVHDVAPLNYRGQNTILLCTAFRFTF